MGLITIDEDDLNSILIDLELYGCSAEVLANSIKIEGEDRNGHPINYEVKLR